MDTLFFKSRHGENPFEDEPLPGGHYHPSLQQNLTDIQKEITPLPQRLPQRDTTVAPTSKDKPIDKPTPAETDFLQKTNSVTAKELPSHDTPSPSNISSKFDESWPASERPSTIESPSGYKLPSEISNAELNDKGPLHAPGPSMHPKPPGSGSSTSGPDYLAEWRNKYTQTKRDKGLVTDGSTLAKYIQRFRYSEPKSRQEREHDKQVGQGSDFWWLAPPSRTSTPTDDESGISKQHLGARSRGRGRPTATGRYGMSPFVSSPERIEEDTEDLQMRAERLLERSESTILSEPAVSSEGIGSSSPSSNSNDQNLTTDVQRPIDHVPQFQAPLLGIGKQAIKKVGLRPEDDILHQWRVRRRLEEARRQTRRMTPVIATSPVSETERPHHEGSRLDEFRQRLKNQQLLSEAKPGLFQIPPSEPVTRTTGTSPIPQTVATQTNGVLPSIGEEVPVRDTNNDPRPLRKNLNGVESTVPSEAPTTHIHDLHDILPITQTYHTIPKSKQNAATKSEKNQPIVASPTMHRTAAQNARILPHLHMACDIIPCPQDSSSRQDSIPFRTQFGNGRKSVDNGQQRQSAVMRKGEKSSCTEPSSAPANITSRELPFSSNLESLQGAAGARSSPPYSPSMHSPSKGVPPKNDNLPQRLDFDIETGNDSLRTQVEQSLLEDGDDGRRTPPSNKDAQASSPIGAAVGQVISDRLFTTPKQSDYSPQSSINSLPSMHSSMMSHRSLDRAAKMSDQPGDDDESSASSDGEEFAEDELLQLLRRRRTQYETQLETLDRLIELQTAGT